MAFISFFGHIPFASPVVTFDGSFAQLGFSIEIFQRVVPPLRQGAGGSR